MREVQDMTQEQLGLKLEPLLGREWSRQAVSSAEQGNRAFTATELVAVARVLGTSVTWLMTPPIAARAIEMPTGYKIDRLAMLQTTAARAAAEHLLGEVGEHVRDLAQVLMEQRKVLTGAIEANRRALETLQLQEKFVRLAEQVTAIRHGSDDQPIGEHTE
ncbi:MAG TPA: helix-turn-helix transcriptional regulator [Mycobacterium sp.]|nr:helix-turn-helix transcriptional regulator [Mycobacterium sp.]